MKKLLSETILLAGLSVFPFTSITQDAASALAATPAIEMGLPADILSTRNSGGRPNGTWFFVSPHFTSDQFYEWYSAVAYNSQQQEYLVVWHGSDATNRYVYGQRVSRDGALIGSRFLISPPVGSNMYADVAYNPARNEYLVVYMVGNYTYPDTSIRGMRIDATGGAVGLERVFSDSAGYSYWEPAVAYSPGTNDYLVTWQKKQGIFQGIEVRTLSGNATSTLGPILEVTGMQAYVEPSLPDVACTRSNDECLVVWQKWWDSNKTDHDINGQRIHMVGGAHLEGFNFGIHTSIHDEGTPAIAAVPLPTSVSEYLVVGVHVEAGQSQIIGALVTDAGTPHFSTILSPTGGLYPAVAGNESTSELLVAWKNGSNIEERTITLRSTEDRTIGPLELMLGRNPYDPAIASGGGGDFLVACHDYLPGFPPDVYGQLWSTPPTVCSGDVVILQNMIFTTGNTYNCTATTSITAGTGVTVQSGAIVNFRAPIINLQAGFKVESGAAFSAKP